MEKLDFTGTRLIVAGTCFIDIDTILKAGDIIHNIEYKPDDEGNHFFEFSVEGSNERYMDSLMSWPLYDETYEHINEAIAIETKMNNDMKDLAMIYREWAKNQPTFGNKVSKLLFS
jgi:hypothetical protein